MCLDLVFDSVNNSYVLGNYAVLFAFGAWKRYKNGEFIEHNAKQTKTLRINPFSAIKFRLNSRSIREASLVVEPNSSNYSHFILSNFPIVHHLNSINFDHPIILPGSFKNISYIAECLSELDNLDFVAMEEYDSIFVNNLLFASNRKSFLNPEIGIGGKTLRDTANFLQERFGIGQSGPERIYISRRNARRKIANEDEIEPVLRKFGFVTVLTEEMSVKEQVRLFSQASVLFAPHGAGMANAIFMKPGSLIMEAAYPTPSRQDRYFFNFSKLLGHKHIFVSSSPADYDRSSDRHLDFLVNASELNTVFELACSTSTNRSD